MKKIYIFLSIIILFIFLISINKTEAFTCGEEFTDTRDSKSYSTVLIGEQCWFKDYLQYDNGCTAITWVNSSDIGWCGWYKDDEITYGQYGLLYQWSAVMNGSTEEEAQGLCPVGTHIPTHYEFTTLERSVCASASCETDFPYDKTTYGWRGTNEGTKLRIGGSSGFDAQLPGFRRYYDGYWYVPNYVFIWSSSLWSGWRGNNPWFRHFRTDRVYSGRDYDQNSANGFSVSCLLNQYNLAYTTGEGGTVDGDLNQTVNYGHDGTLVTAIPNSEYTFLRWSDNSTDNPRVDLNVNGDISVSAIFEKPRSSSGSTVQSRVSNLIAMGKQQEAQNLINQFPNQFIGQEIIVQQVDNNVCTSNIKLTDFMKEGDRDNKYGSYNKKIVTQIKTLQSHINDILADKYTKASGPVDGIFGPLTKQGVKRMQTVLNENSKTNLLIDGIVGPLTQKAINEYCGN